MGFKVKNMETWRNIGIRIWEWMKKYYVRILICVNILFATLSLIGYFVEISDRIRLEFTEEQIQSYNTDRCIGGIVDEGYDSGLYDIIPDMFLEKGYYTYTVSYEGQSNNSFCWPHTYEMLFNVIEQETVLLNNDKFTDTRKFWLNADLNIALRLSYSGEGSVVFTGFAIEETNVLANIELFCRLLFLIGVDLGIFLFVWLRKKPISKSAKYVAAALFTLAVLASFPPMNGYMIDGHDIEFHLARIEGIKEGILSGQFPVRISPVFYNGYGYANSIFYGELLLYFPGILRVVGFSVAQSYNAFLIALNIITIAICFYCSKKIINDDTIAVTVTTLYTLCPYRLADIYTRAAIGEATAMAFLPLVAYGLYRIFMEDTQSKKYRSVYLTLAIALTGVIQSHVLTVEMAAGFILLTCVILCFKTLQKKRFWALIKTVIATIFLNLWFLVPFVDFMLTQDVRIFSLKKDDLLQTTGLYFSQIFSMFSDYAVLNLSADNGVASEMFFSMGLALGLGMVLFAVMIWEKEDEKDKYKKEGIFFLGLAVLAVWMTTIYFPWDTIATRIPMARTLIASIQFIWRFMGIAAVLASIVTGFGLYLLKKKEGKNVLLIAASILTVLTVITAMDLFEVNLFNKPPMNLTENTFVADDTSFYVSGGEYALCDIRYYIVTEEFEPRSFDGVTVSEYQKQGTNITFNVENDNTDGYVLLPLLNYKGYGAKSEDGVITSDNVQMGEDAVVRVNIPANYKGTVSVYYQGFWYWRVAEVVSLLAVFYYIYLGIKSRKQV